MLPSISTLQTNLRSQITPSITYLLLGPDLSWHAAFYKRPPSLLTPTPVNSRGKVHTRLPLFVKNTSGVSMHLIAAAFQDSHDIPPVKMKLMVGARQKESYRSSRVITAADQKQSQLLQGHMCGPGLRGKTLWHKAIGGNQNMIQNKRMSDIFYLESNVSKPPLPADNHPANPRHKTDLRISSRTLSWHLFTSEELLWRYRGRWSNLTICFLSTRLYFLNFLIYLSKG